MWFGSGTAPEHSRNAAGVCNGDRMNRSPAATEEIIDGNSFDSCCLGVGRVTRHRIPAGSMSIFVKGDVMSTFPVFFFSSIC